MKDSLTRFLEQAGTELMALTHRTSNRSANRSAGVRYHPVFDHIALQPDANAFRIIE